MNEWTDELVTSNRLEISRDSVMEEGTGLIGD